jgi:hypothetical protein
MTDSIMRNPIFKDGKDIKLDKSRSCQDLYIDYFGAHSPWSNNHEDRAVIHQKK